jgi:hypothetical protein
MNNRQNQKDKTVREIIDEEYKPALGIMRKFCLTLTGGIVVMFIYIILFNN